MQTIKELLFIAYSVPHIVLNFVAIYTYESPWRIFSYAWTDPSFIFMVAYCHFQVTEQELIK